jgi:pimeloyl-ACP methyl ester carboxylesterase
MPRFLYVAVLLCSFAFLEGCKSFVIQPRSWDYKGHEIGYEVSHKIKPDAETSEMDIRDKEKEPVLLLNGFGVGSFHQHRLIPRLLEQEQDRIIYGIDYLGQGRSWPRACQDGDSEAEKGLRYDAEMWIDQVVTFIEEVVLPEHEINGKGPTKVHLIGNSIGGHLAAHLSLLRPDLVESICLLNPTPVWGLNLPGWCGHLPAPAIPKKIGRYLFDRIRDLTIIEKYLESAYARREAFDEELVCFLLRLDNCNSSRIEPIED